MIQSSLSDHNGIKVEIKNGKIILECLNYVKIKNLNNPRIKEEGTREIRNVFKLNENKNTTYENMGDLFQTRERVSNNYLSFHLKEEKKSTLKQLEGLKQLRAETVKQKINKQQIKIASLKRLIKSQHSRLVKEKY